MAKKIATLLAKAKEPMETTEITKAIMARDPFATRTIVLYRLQLLAAAQLIKGKNIGSGKGTWVWWVA